MNILLGPDRASASTTRISSNLEELWRRQFFAGQGQTPADVLLDSRAPERENSLRRMAATIKFSGGAYDSAIIRFYEDIILELQKQVLRYKTLWQEVAKAEWEDMEETYVARQTLRPTEGVIRKLRGRTKPGLRISAE